MNWKFCRFYFFTSSPNNKLRTAQSTNRHSQFIFIDFHDCKTLATACSHFSHTISPHGLLSQGDTGEIWKIGATQVSEQMRWGHTLPPLFAQVSVTLQPSKMPFASPAHFALCANQMANDFGQATQFFAPISPTIHFYTTPIYTVHLPNSLFHTYFPFSPFLQDFSYNF